MIYKKSVADPGKRTDELAEKYAFTARSRWRTAIKGFAAELPEKTVQELRCEEGIDFIEQDARMAAQ